MSAIGQNVITPFGRPAGPWDPDMGSTIVRGNDNVIVEAFNDHDSDASIHVVTTSTAGVTTGATTILPTPVGAGFAFVAGTDGSTAFVDQVAWHATGSATAVSSTSVKGSPAARTYSVSAGALQLAMASSTYAITAIPLALS